MPHRAQRRAIASAPWINGSTHTPTVSALIAATLFVLVLLVAPAARGQPVRLLGVFTVPVPGGGFVADVWGWVDPSSGREYAIVGTSPVGIHIIDVTDATLPVLVRSVTNAPGFDVKTWGKWLYACDGNASGVDTRVLDISDPANPVLQTSLLPSAHNITISDAGMMYLSVPGLRALNLALDPVNPFVWFSASGAGHDATCRGNMVYDFSGASSGARIFRYTPPITLAQLGTCLAPGITYYHSGDQSADGTFLFVTDELAVSPAADITIFDIDPPATPQKVGSLNDPTATVHNLYVVGDVMVTSYYTAGFKAFNVANPASPSLIGVYDTSAQTGEGYQLGGAFGVYPFLPSGNILVSDTVNGLFVFNLTTTTAVRFSDVQARPGANGVELSWRLHSDETIAGFHVYRSAGDGERRLTTQPLAPDARGYRDADATPGGSYGYVVAAVRPDGSEERSPRVSAAVPELTAGQLTVFPNPFNPETTISYVADAATHARIEVFDGSGARVRTLFDGPVPAGSHTTVWDGRSDAGTAVASGVYLVRLRAGNATSSRRMVLLK